MPTTLLHYTPLRAPHLGSSGVVHQASYSSSIDHGRQHLRHQTSLMAAACRCHLGVWALMSLSSSISCRPSLPFPALPCFATSPPSLLVKNMQGGLHYRLHSRSVRIRNHSPGRFDWASSLVDLPKRRPPLLLWRRAMFSLSTGHGYANVIDLLRAAAGDLRTEIVRVAFSIWSQSITIWARSLNSQVSLPPRNQLDNGLG